MKYGVPKLSKRFVAAVVNAVFTGADILIPSLNTIHVIDIVGNEFVEVTRVPRAAY